MTRGRLKLKNRLSVQRIACLLIFAIVGNLSHAAALTERFEGRDMLVHVPKAMPAAGTRALVIVLHGGMGNASRIEDGRSENGLNLDQVADNGGFLVAYLNGTRAAPMFGSQALAWNAGGGCCGLPARSDVDDLRYIDGAARHVAAEYGIDPHRIYVMGHSNGGMMSQRLICEPSVFSAAIAVSGPLNLSLSRCPGAAGKKIMSIHGTADLEVPVAGGRGQGISGVAFASEATSSQVMKNSGAQYDLVLVNGAPHMLNHIDESLKRESGASISETAVNYFGLSSGR